MSELKNIDLEKALRITLKTGKVIIGSKRTLKAVKLGKVQMVIKANNCPEYIASDVYKYCQEFEPKIKIIEYNGSSWDLGFICGKPFMISLLGIVSVGDSELKNLLKN